MLPSMQALSTGVLLLLSVALLLPPVWVKLSATISRLKPGSHSEPVGESSDAPAPPGFAAHVQLLRAASLSAPAETREAYYLKALTKAQALQAEVTRLTKRASK